MKFSGNVTEGVTLMWYFFQNFKSLDAGSTRASYTYRPNVPHGTEQVVCTNVQNAKKVQVDTRKVISNGKMFILVLAMCPVWQEHHHLSTCHSKH